MKTDSFATDPGRQDVQMTRRLSVAIVVLLGALTIATRAWDLDGRLFHSDEAAHAWFTGELVEGRGYHADPVFHGPLLYHLEAAVFLLAGLGDWQARATSAAAGCLVVLLIFVLAWRHVGRREAFVASGLAVASPSLVFYSRFNNHDLLVAATALVVLIAVLEGARAPRSWPVVVATAAIAAGIATKLNVYFVVGTLVAYALACSVVRPTWRASARRAIALVPRRAYGLAALTGALMLAALFATTFLYHAGQPGASAADAAWNTWLAIWVDGFRHWNEVHGSPRLGGPFYYYGLLLLVYEPLVPAGAVLATVIFSERRRAWLAAVVGAAIAGLVAALISMGHTAAVERMLHLRPAYLVLLLPAVTATGWAVVSLWRSRRETLAFLLFFAAVQTLLYSYAGEKVPWLVVHVAVPWMVVASAAIVECWEHTRAAVQRGVLVIAAGVLVVPSLSGTWALLTFNRSNVVEPLLQVEYGTDVGRLVDVTREVARSEKDATPAVIDRDLSMPFTWYLRDLPIDYPDGVRVDVAAPVVVTQEDVPALHERYVGRQLHYHVWSSWTGALRNGGIRALVRFWWKRDRLGPRGSREFHVWIRRDVEARRTAR